MSETGRYCTTCTPAERTTRRMGTKWNGGRGGFRGGRLPSAQPHLDLILIVIDGPMGPSVETSAAICGHMIMHRTQCAFHRAQGHHGSNASHAVRLPQGEITSSRIAPKGKFQMFASHHRKAAPMARAKAKQRRGGKGSAGHSRPHL